MQYGGVLDLVELRSVSQQDHGLHEQGQRVERLRILCTLLRNLVTARKGLSRIVTSMVLFSFVTVQLGCVTLS